MFKENLIVYLNGEFTPLSESNISPLTHSLHYGSGVFEGIRAYSIKNGVGVLKLEEHVDRLFYSAKKIGLEISQTREEMQEAILQTVAKNNLQSAYIRPLVFFDHSSLGIGTSANKTSVLIAAWEWGKYLPDSVTAQISSLRRISEQSTICDAKIAGHYVNSLLATNKAKAAGFNEALLLDHDGNIAEGPAENIFFVKGKELHTPQLGKILAGITRKLVMDIAKKHGYSVTERTISPSEISDFDGAFFTGTAAEVTSLSKIVHQNGEEVLLDVSAGSDIKETFFYMVSTENEDSDGNFTLI